MLFYVMFASGDFKRIAKVKLIFYQLIFYTLTVGIAYLIFRHKVLDMPKGHNVYIIAIVVLSICSMILLDYCIKKMKFFKKKTEKGTEENRDNQKTEMEKGTVLIK